MPDDDSKKPSHIHTVSLSKHDEIPPLPDLPPAEPEHHHRPKKHVHPHLHPEPEHPHHHKHRHHSHMTEGDVLARAFAERKHLQNAGVTPLAKVEDVQSQPVRSAKDNKTEIT